MGRTELLYKMSRGLHKAGFVLKKYTPEILMVAGAVGTVGTTVLACKATLKLDEVVAEPKEKIEKIHEFMEHPEKVPSGKEYTEEDGKKDIRIIYAQTGLKIAKLYGPALLLGTASLAAMFGGHNMLRKRNIAIAAAYAALGKEFKDYRGGVIERFGEELDKEIKFKLKDKEIEEVVKNEDGSESIITKNIRMFDPDEHGPNAKFFCEGCAGFIDGDPENNLRVLLNQEKYANMLLAKKTYMSVNDVYGLLGIAHTARGQVDGWIYDPTRKGEKQIDFGIYDGSQMANRRFVNGLEDVVLLDFNAQENFVEYL